MLIIDCNCSPVNVPFVEQEPFLCLGQVHMDILIDTTNCKNLVVVSHGLCTEELFRLPERAFHTLNLANLRVKSETI